MFTGLIVAWTLADFFSDSLSFTVPVPEWFRGDEELAAAVVRFFGALVLVLFPVDDEMGRRLHWVAGGFFLLGLGYLAFGYVEPLVLGVFADLNEELYEEIFVRTAAGILFIIALVPETPPRFRGRLAVAVVLLVAAFVSLLKLPIEVPLPPLVGAAYLEQAGSVGAAAPGWLTPWHWMLWAVPLILALVAAAAAVLRYRSGELRGWLLTALVVWAGSIMNEYLYPSGYYNHVLTTTGVLHTVFGVVVAVGGVYELRRIARERAALLAVEREQVRKMGELAALRADFSDMIAHELDAPLSAIRQLARMVGLEDLDPRVRASSLGVMDKEIDALVALVEDVRTAAATERDDFEVALHPVPLTALVTSAAAFADTLPGDHRVEVVVGEGSTSERVMADPERIGQVLRNLLSNAAKYSPDGAPIELRAHRSRRSGRVAFEVTDRGRGIPPDDLALIFEKFARGRSRKGKSAGAGLGLYISRRIVQSHGSSMTVTSRPGEGTVFGFELETAR